MIRYNLNKLQQKISHAEPLYTKYELQDHTTSLQQHASRSGPVSMHSPIGGTAAHPKSHL